MGLSEVCKLQPHSFKGSVQWIIAHLKEEFPVLDFHFNVLGNIMISLSPIELLKVIYPCY